MQCPRCQQENPSRAKFCLECGTRLVLTCAQCSTELPPSVKFCLECGQPVAAPPAAPPRFTAPETYTPQHLAEKILTARSDLVGERKQVTVLFADLKGSTELIEGLDPEEARTLLDSALHAMQAAMRRYAEEVRRTRLLAVQITTPGSILLTATALRLVEGLAQVSGARGAGPV